MMCDLVVGVGIAILIPASATALPLTAIFRCVFVHYLFVFLVTY